LPFARDDRLVEISRVDIPLRVPGFGEHRGPSPEITELAGLRDAFSGYAAYAPGGLNLSGVGEPARVRVALVTPGFFPTLGVKPALGRAFRPHEGTPEAAPAAILSHGLWLRHFGGDPGALGKTATLNGRRYRVVGVMEPGFAFPARSEVWLPLPVPMTFDHWEPFRQYMPTTVIGRLAPGVTVEEAGSRFRALLLQREQPKDEPLPTAGELVRPLRATLVGERGGALWILFGATLLLLLVAAANVATLLLSRTAARRPELAVRAALGASPRRVLQQLLTESLLLAAIGGVLGVAVAVGGLRALDALIPEGLAGAAPLRLDGRVLLFALALVLLTGLVAGLSPVARARRIQGGEVVRSGGATGGLSRGGTRVRRALVVGELAAALVLLIGAGVMLRSFHALTSIDAGLQPERVATLELTLAQASYATPAARRAFIGSVLQRLQADPRVQSAAFINELPLRGEGGIRITVQAEGRTAEEPVFAQDLRATPDYFRTAGIPLRRGRTLAAVADSLAPAEVVVNEALARRLWPGQDALGKRLVFPGTREPIEVVGIAANARAAKLDEDSVMPQMYHSLAVTPYKNMALLARGRVSAEVLPAVLQEAVRATARDQAVYNVRTMEEVIASTIAPRRTNTLLLSLFGALAAALAALGVYGVVAYGVVRRTREIGIRLALGARQGQVMRSVMGEGLALAAAGAVLGLAGAWALTRALATLAYGVSPADPVSFAAGPVALVAVALLATLLPARRATRVDPSRAMRSD
ncbi:MAG TPA: ADOP family duplicated permease, partial [Longimicrobium sp.]